MKQRVCVVVSGPPASGKSTLALELADGLGLPLVAKDTIKQALMDAVPPNDIEQSKQLGRAALATMYAVADASPIGAVIESTFHRSAAITEIAQLNGTMVEVFCRCRREVAAGRYRARAESRHVGHFDAERTADEIWNDENAVPVAGGWSVIEVDTNAPVDAESVLAKITATLAKPLPELVDVAVGADDGGDERSGQRNGGYAGLVEIIDQPH